ncbi:sacsin-like isoform X2 [Ostrea edulis]|uniref:sacsin-like isoform X2 n=1 Tax=Ostrea edulis TaxID=37623 RepID=UPI0024AEEA3D|nr:sacsin-like isoform X2 [Ostrea edulis]
MSSKVKYHAYRRNTLLEELQSILHEYPDNEQIIKELLQNAEDAGARVVKMGFCPTSKSDYLPDAYRKYLSGPALCFYNDSIFEEEDWDGITMVRKSNKQDNPLKVGKFGIGFKSVFHVTDTVCVISGRTILFIDPLCELQDPQKVCCFVQIADYVHQDVCGPRGLEPLFDLFGISEETVRSGEFKGTLFWFPLRNSPSELSENVYTLEKIADLLKSFKEEIGSELLFLTSVENIGVYKINNGNCETEYSVALDGSCTEKARKDRDLYKTKIRDIEEKMSDDDNWIFHCAPVWMKSLVTYQVKMDEMETSQKWLIIQNFHTGSMNNELSSLIRNRRSKYRPYIGIAARLDEAIQSGQIFCFLPLPFENESSTGLPVHINGYFALDSNRQHLKWPSQDQVVSQSHLENDMLWNLLMVQEILPIVYKEFLKAWQDDSLGTELTENYLEMFYHHIPRMSAVKNHWACVGTEVHNHVLQSEIPCLHKGQWIKSQEAYYCVFSKSTPEDVTNTVTDLFQRCIDKVIILQEHEDLFHFWRNQFPNMKCTDPKETRNLLKRDNRYKQLKVMDKENLLIYCCSDGILNDLDGIELLPLQNRRYKTFQAKSRGYLESIYLCEKEELEILIGKEGHLVMSTSCKVGKVLNFLATSDHYSFQRLHRNACIQFLKEIVHAQRQTVGNPLFLKGSSAIFGEYWLKKVWKYLKTHCQQSLDPVRDLCIMKTKESDSLKNVSDSFLCDADMVASGIDILAYFKIWIVDMVFHDHPLIATGKGIVVDCTDDGKVKLLQHNIMNGINSFNSNSCPNTKREWFKDFLPLTLPMPLASHLSSLKMFKCYSSAEVTSQFQYTSLEQCHDVYVGDRDFPIEFPTNMILSMTRKEDKLLSELSATKIDLTDCIQKCLKKFSKEHLPLNEEKKRRFCFYVLEKQSELRNWWKIQTDLNTVKFIQNGTAHLCSASELYDPSNTLLTELFLLESKFPKEDGRKMDLLKHLPFQSNNSDPAFRNDIIETCHEVDSKIQMENVKQRKSKALLQIFRQMPNVFTSVLHSISRCKILPFKQVRNVHYPKSMKWYSDAGNFVSLEMIYSSTFEYVVGSVLPVSTREWEDHISSTKTPPLKSVIQHFEQVTKCYSENEHVEYSFIMKEVYQCLARENWNRSGLHFPQYCVLTEFGFVQATDVYVERSRTDIDLEPYYIPLPKEYSSLRGFFEKVGCNQKQSTSLLVKTLYKIKKKWNDQRNLMDLNQDLCKVERLLRKLSECSEEDLSEIRENIIVPIHSEDSNTIAFKNAQECAYSDSDWFSKTFTDEDNICLIHGKIEKTVAKKLGVKSLKQFTLSDAEEIYSEFGQSEPLTQRLSRLLEEGYTDGLSVPKELIQNADDAGASEIYFLYDERENEEARTCLLDSGMKGCQGPALWAFNDAVFSSNDFENIQKLSGATKKEDTTKIGKFGLGFNAVYNLTDVPSFASGKHLVYLDPHGTYLGEAISHEKSPGIKLNLHNKTMLRKLENQFKPFEKVFGFQSSKFSENKGYKGTLFRFPLRTKQQALTSEICNKEYSRTEMNKLLEMFCKASGNMLLFTQNVKKIKLYHLGKISSNPDMDMQLVLAVEKDEENGNSMKKSDENILTAASRHLNRWEHSSKFLPTCITKIQVSSKGHAWTDKSLPFKEETKWLITWALGTKKSMKLFKEKKSDGALPIASVAIPVETANNRFSPLCLGGKTRSFEKYGFYETGHLFCFLPLPIKTAMHFHVNGSFAVSSDRQRLLIKTEDDKEITKQSIWNECLVNDATVEAFLELLVVVHKTSTEDDALYELWPTESYDSFWQTFQNEFFRSIVQRELPLFKTNLGYRNFQDCLFLHKDLKSDKQLSQIAFDILREIHLYGKIITEIPNNVYRELEKCLGAAFSEHVVTYEKFITECFLPNISRFNGEKYDNVVLGAIRSKNALIIAALKETECITTSPSGIRKSPKSLVHPRSSVSGLFLTEDERFPVDLFCREDDLEILVRLGMMKFEIPFEILLLQTRGVNDLSTVCSECALLRSREIVRYVHRMVPKIPNEIINQMSDIKFLPVAGKPDNWTIRWYNETSVQEKIQVNCKTHKNQTRDIELFEKPINLYFSSVHKLVGCSQYVIARYDLYRFYEKELQSLGVKNEDDIDTETLKRQLCEITKMPGNAQNKDIEDICFDIYNLFAKKMVEPDVKHFIQTELSDLPSIITEKSFVFPKQVIFSLMHDCSPHFYGLRSKYASRFSSLMETLGVRKSFEPKDIIDALLKIKEHHDHGCKQLSDNDLGLVCRITTLFENFPCIPTENLFLPDSSNVFCNVEDLCIDDFDWITTTSSMKFLNAAISLKVAKLAGIKSKRDQSILNDSEDLGDEFGQHEELTNRIKRILDGYPKACILKELLQNADDAGATELHFIKDFRFHGTEHTFSDNWKDLQGPALCVYNDSIFTNKDLIGIQKLGIGSKGEDPTSTGQYGVGFNVVYHLTDVPSFLTRDLQLALDTLCILDPHRKYITCSSAAKPGRKFQNASETVKKRFKDIMPCYLENSGIWKSSSGTLFRFPLRRIADSSLSQKQITCQELDTLLNELRKEMAECLLFLHNVRKILVSSVKEDGTLKMEFSVTAEVSNKLQKGTSLHELVRNVREQMKENPLYACEVDRKEIKYHLNININEKFIEEWLVIAGFGFFDKNAIPEKIKLAYEGRQLALLPSCGVAFNLKNKRISRVQDVAKSSTLVPLYHCRAFYFLPLPVHTGLPVHINGHFALDHEARRNIWWPDDKISDDLKLEWNRCLIESVIVPTYISLLEYLRTTLFPDIISRKPWKQLEKFHKAFPYIHDLKDKIWAFAAKVLYNRIAKGNCCVFPIVRRDYQMLEMADAKDKDDHMQPEVEHNTETTNTNKTVLQEEPLEIKWVSIMSGSFPAYFDEIKFQLRNDFQRQNYDAFHRQTYSEMMLLATTHSEFVAGVLKDLGMKLIESPMWLYNSMKHTDADVQAITPKAVLHFLKSYVSTEIDSCNIEKVGVHVSDTRFRNIDGVYFILHYCLRDDKLNTADFKGVPLLLTTDQQIHEFRQDACVLLTSYPALLPTSANKIAHLSQLQMLTEIKLFQTFVKNLEIEDFSDLVSNNVPKTYLRKTIEVWNPQSNDIPNARWIKIFLCFLSENLTCIENKRRYSQKKKKKNKEESPLVTVCRSIQMHLGGCSFLPVKLNDEHRLYPLKWAKHVLKIIPDIDGPEQLALATLNVPVVYESCFPSAKEGYYPAEQHTLEIIKCLVATVESVKDTLDCVYANRECLKLENEARDIVLEYFARHIGNFRDDANCQMKLKCLPFYSGLDKDFVPLSDGTNIVLPDDIPLNGLSEFGRQTTLVFIRRNDVSLYFLKYLGCVTMSQTKFYINYVLPHFKNLPSTAIMQHLKFIKDIILHELEYSPDEDDKAMLESLEYLLKNTAFLPTCSNRLACACEFYNPHKDIFRVENQLCNSIELPLAPFNEPEWEDFLVHCGMKSKITPQIFIEFAHRLQTLGEKLGLSPIVVNNSKTMVTILFSNDYELLRNASCMQGIQNIRFLIPHSVPQIYSTFAQQFENGRRLICFCESTVAANDLLVWSVMGIISEDITSSVMRKSDIAIAAKTLRLSELPPIHLVIEHTRIVCSALQYKLTELLAQDTKVEEAVTRMMNSIYMYLRKHGNDESMRLLKIVPFIFIKDRKLLVLPEQVVLDISMHEEIPPYLCKAPLYFGQFHSLFEAHGASQFLTCSHLAKVLHKIWEKSKGKLLEPNEMKSTEKAVQILFSKLKLEKAVDLKVTTLYLPSKNKNLIRSDSLVFVDNKLLEERIGNNMPDMDFFVGFKELKIDVHDPVFEISQLPENHRPRLLSKVVTEQLDSECKNWIIPSDHGRKLQGFLHSREFITGVYRLVRDELYNNDKSCGEKEAIEIQNKIESVFVVCVERLATVMVFKNKELSNTSKQRMLFSEEELGDNDSSKLCIYFKIVEDTKIQVWINDIAKKVSSSLNAYLGKPLKENHIHLPDVLKCMQDPSAIDKELDSLEIRKLEENMSAFLPFMPELGSEIPVLLHHLLDNSCTYIEPGEYVAYELFDPVIDEDDGCNTEPVYILAKVQETMSNRPLNCPHADEWSICYLIDVGNENLIEVVASKVYKFIRSDITDGNVDVVDGAVVFRWNNDRVKSYIRDVLRNAFRRSDQELKRAAKRLLLQYHPDKHQDNKDYFKELTQFIYFIKSRLEQGESVDDIVIFEAFNNQPYVPTSRFAETCHNRGKSHARYQRDYNAPAGGSSGFFNSFYSRGSQPGQARRWFRQAEADYRASVSDTHQSDAYNWACFKCHQNMVGPRMKNCASTCRSFSALTNYQIGMC